MDDNVMKQTQIAVYEKALLTLPLTGPQAELICEKTQELHGRLHKENAKDFLRGGRFAEALAAARQAQKAIPSAKLSLVVLGLQFFPQGMGAAYHTYEGFLQRKQKRKKARFRGVKSAPGRKPDYEAFSEFAGK